MRVKDDHRANDVAMTTARRSRIRGGGSDHGVRTRRALIRDLVERAVADVDDGQRAAGARVEMVRVGAIVVPEHGGHGAGYVTLKQRGLRAIGASAEAGSEARDCLDEISARLLPIHGDDARDPTFGRVAH
jgi:hypothetical protein